MTPSQLRRLFGLPHDVLRGFAWPYYLRSNEMDIKDYRLTDAAKHNNPSITIEEMIAAGWTIPLLIQQGYIELIPTPPAAPDDSKPGPVKTSDIASQVINEVTARDAHGQQKYGVSLDREDLTSEQWLQHLFEELIDGAHYVKAAKREVTRRDTAAREAISKAFNSTQDECRQLMNDADYDAFKRGIGMIWDKLTKAGLVKPRMGYLA